MGSKSFVEAWGCSWEGSSVEVEGELGELGEPTYSPPVLRSLGEEAPISSSEDKAFKVSKWLGGYVDFKNLRVNIFISKSGRFGSFLD